MVKEQKGRTPIKFLKLIPDFIWPLVAVVIGGMLTWIPLHWQLEHESREREKERQMSVRLDVYLFAAEKIGECLTYLIDFPNKREFPREGYWEAINQIQIIGSKETLAAVCRFNEYMEEAFTELAPQVFEIVLLEERLDSLTELLYETKEERKIYIEEMKEHNLSGIIDEHKWSVIKANSASARSRFDQLMREHNKTGKEILKLTSDLAPKCVKKAQAGEELLIPVMVAIRKELDAPFDEKAYRERMKAGHNKSKANIEKYIASMKHKYEQAFQAIEQEKIFYEQ